jgi:hypothetical protein
MSCPELVNPLRLSGLLCCLRLNANSLGVLVLRSGSSHPSFFQSPSILAPKNSAFLVHDFLATFSTRVFAYVQGWDALHTEESHVGPSVHTGYSARTIADEPLIVLAEFLQRFKILLPIFPPFCSSFFEATS